MTQPLLIEARSQSWGAPNPFDQVIIRPSRLSRVNGQMRTVQTGWRSYALPNNTSRFHVYRTGQVDPKMLNLHLAGDSWQLLSQAMQETNVLVQVHTQNGVMLPITRTWYRWVDLKNILIAVEVNANIAIDWAAPEVFVRLYNNSFFQSALSSNTDGLSVAGGLMQTASQISQLAVQLAQITSAPGYAGGAVAYVNGWRVNAITLQNTKVGDSAEFVYDTSVYKVVDFNYSSLPSFVSTLDGKSKRLLHYEAQGPRLIDYEDHIDLYMWDAGTGRGCYVHKNAADTMRQLTYKDYSVVSDYLSAYHSNFANARGQVDVSQLRLRMYVRYSGQGLMPALESSMSKFLMDMPDAQQLQAMVGPGATLPLWQAANLESGAYMRLLRAKYNDITSELVEQAYGYYRVNQVLGQSIQSVGASAIAVPAAYQASSTAYEYRSDGTLIGTATLSNQLMYTRQSDQAVSVEFVEGLGGKVLDEYSGSEPVTLQAARQYRFYIKIANPQGGQALWQDVTGSSHYSVQDGVAHWSANAVTVPLERLVRSDKSFLDYETMLSLQDGVLVHQLSCEKTTLRGVVSSPLQVPLGELDVWLNDHPLVRGVDYIFKFPSISIVNKSFLNTQGSAPHLQKLRVRMQGFCDSQLNPTPLDEVGFVYNGVLSANGKHDLHREKVQRIVVNGALKRLDQVAFMEEGSDAQTQNSPLEGKPYEVRDVINRLSGLIDSEPYALWRKTRQDQLAAENYVSMRVSDVPEQLVVPIVQRYELFSPFLSKILSDLVADFIDLGQFEQPYSDVIVRALCAPYQYLLALDPVGAGNEVDSRYCVIHPHPQANQISLSVLQYAFFERVVAIFAPGKVVYSPLVNLAP